MKKLITALLAITLAVSLSGCTRNVKNKKITIDTFDATGQYTGEWKDGAPCGYGEFESEDESLTYEGDWMDGLPNGYGECENYDDGYGYYEGEWKNGKMHGDGTLFGKGTEDGIPYNLKYSGQFYRGKYQGTGNLEIEYKQDGTVVYFRKYSGELKNGFASGTGTLIEGSSEEYYKLTGSFLEGNPSGQLNYELYTNGQLEQTGIYENGKFKSSTGIIVDNILDKTLGEYAHSEGFGDLYDILSGIIFG